LKFYNRSKSNALNKESKYYDEVNNKEIGLSKVIRANFDKNKIRNLENPNSQEIFFENRYIRDKTDITTGMNKLKETIRIFLFIKFKIWKIIMIKANFR
jgi:hypothetical protein